MVLRWLSWTEGGGRWRRRPPRCARWTRSASGSQNWQNTNDDRRNDFVQWTVKDQKKKKRDERGHLHAVLGVHILSITLEVHHLDKASNFTAIIFCYKSSHNHVIVLYSSHHTNFFRSVVTSMKKSVITVSTVFTLSMSFAIGPWKLYYCCSRFQLFAKMFQNGFLGPETLRLEAKAGWGLCSTRRSRTWFWTWWWSSPARGSSWTCLYLLR